jgi:hypothetical protein
MIGLLRILLIAISLAFRLIISFVYSYNNHFVMLNACFKNAIKGKYFALFRDTNKVQARLTQAELSKYF